MRERWESGRDPRGELFEMLTLKNVLKYNFLVEILESRRGIAK